MIGGGQGAFFGAAHRAAARLTDHFDLVAGAFSSDPARGAASAAELHIAPARSYADFRAMAATEAACPDGAEVVTIVTPNHLHHAAARACLEHGLHVICDKPVTTTLADALDLQTLAASTGRQFQVTYTNAGYGLVRDARAMVAAGRLGQVHLVRVEFPQEWLASAVETSGNKQAEWRTDPARSGAGCLADIGTHAFHLAEFVSGLRCHALCGEVRTIVPGRRVDDEANLLLRFAGGATGALWASQVAIGQSGGLKLEIYGDRGALQWRASEPNRLLLSELNGKTEVIERAGRGTQQAGRLPAGHPEGFLEALSQLYDDMAEKLLAAIEGRAPHASAAATPGIEDGVRGLHMVEAALRSKGQWTAL
jgi:predicted dehydrogenase